MARMARTMRASSDDQDTGKSIKLSAQKRHYKLQLTNTKLVTGADARRMLVRAGKAPQERNHHDRHLVKYRLVFTALPFLLLVFDCVVWSRVGYAPAPPQIMSISS